MGTVTAAAPTGTVLHGLPKNTDSFPWWVRLNTVLLFLLQY
jgi:hypothetical protein